MSFTIIPGDMVKFNGQEWKVFIASKSDQPDAAVCIFRYENPQRASDVIDLIRQRQELTFIPRLPDHGRVTSPCRPA